MWTNVKRLAKRLRRETSGNTTLLFALGMPMFVGGAGLAVDTAQWYMWQREMQYAVDQAALAGAWSRVGGTTGNEYQTRAQQELDANLQIVDFEGTPSISLANYAGGVNNSVVVTLNGTKSLPFSSMLTGGGTTVAVTAQAAFEKGRTFTSCLIAVDPDTKGAITIGGSAYVVANCGAAALSTDPEAIVKDGNATFDVGYLVATGGIDDDFEDGDNEIFENQTGLVDPFKDLVPPTNDTPRTYECLPATTKYTATYSDVTTVEEKTYTGKNANALKLDSTQTVSSGTQTKTTEVDAQADVGDKVIDTSSTQTGNVVAVSGGYRRVDTVTKEVGTITQIDTVSTQGGAQTLPGTYAEFRVACDTTMGKGVYVIDGGLFKINATDSIVGLGVMIVLKNGAGIEINGNSSLNFRAMTTEEMITFGGLSEEQAIKLKDMLIFEDRNSPGYEGNSVNGTAGAILDGTVYLPASDLTFNGTFGVVSRCLVITAKKIKISGDTHMESFCPSGVTNTVSIGGGATSVRLVK